MMKQKLDHIRKETLAAIAAAKTAQDIEKIEQKVFGRKNGTLTESLKMLKDISGEVRKEVGQKANELKDELQKALENARVALAEKEEASLVFDISEPSLPRAASGTLHPITLIQQDLEDVLSSMGFMILDGPELESDFYNFEALNIPTTHPARDSQDTFYVKGHSTWLMRTHTSSMQVRALREYGAPVMAVVPGRCFRNEATDARHEHTFFQLEGFMVGENITFCHLKGVLEAIAKHLYGPDTRIRLRPKYYPFVEPGVNGEVTCMFCKGSGCRLCKQTGYLEIFGAGMIHNSVLRAGNLDPEKVQGFAFGLGLTRLAMLKYGIDDIRLFESQDFSFLSQFTSI
ncbi:phenylalanine--tRNA ligase subunit alpha [Candidatus Uhrbacteria bacterium]|nr:phenylalanine--tRNA ligase subunit alpha [Candidatus Uhrbacteria bacterium]